MASNFNNETRGLRRRPGPCRRTRRLPRGRRLRDRPSSGARALPVVPLDAAGEDGGTEFCSHREVKPYAGTTGFDAEAWCPECPHYKLRRSPKKRERTDEWGYSSRHSRAIRPEAPGNSLSELSAVVDHDVFDIPHCTSGADSRRRGLLLFQIKLNAHLCLVIAERRPQAVRR